MFSTLELLKFSQFHLVLARERSISISLSSEPAAAASTTQRHQLPPPPLIEFVGPQVSCCFWLVPCSFFHQGSQPCCSCQRYTHCTASEGARGVHAACLIRRGKMHGTRPIQHRPTQKVHVQKWQALVKCNFDFPGEGEGLIATITIGKKNNAY